MEKSCQESGVLLDNRIDYGPIRFYSRRKKAPTLSTGRKSRFEELDGEEFEQRELRREKNRFLSKQLKEKREKICNDLLEEAHQLEQSNGHLSHSINQLQSYQNHLLNQLQYRDQKQLLHQQQFEVFTPENHSNIYSNEQIFDQIPDDTFLFDYLLSDQS